MHFVLLINNPMDKNTLLQLAKEIYQLTLLFPTKEPLRYRLREIADEIIAVFISQRNNYLQDIQSQIEILDSFLDIAANQNWTAPARITALQQSYRDIARELSRLAMAKSVAPIILPAATSPKALKPAVSSSQNSDQNSESLSQLFVEEEKLSSPINNNMVYSSSISSSNIVLPLNDSKPPQKENLSSNSKNKPKTSKKIALILLLAKYPAKIEYLLF